MQQYLNQSYPMDSILRMMFMGGLAEQYGDSRQRRLRFSFKKDVYWVDHGVKDEKSLRDALLSRRPEQVHFDTLLLSSPFSSSCPEEKKIRVREVMFDVDVTEYERFCPCKDPALGKKVCSRCWQFVEGASLVLDFLLRVHYGIPEGNILWILSGMKGFHCLVNDARFLFKTRKERLYLFQLLNRFSEKELIEFATRYLQPWNEGFSEILLAQFEERSVIKRGMMSLDSFQDSCLSLLSREYPSLRNKMELVWFNLRAGTSLDKWRGLREQEKFQFPGSPPPSLIIALRCYWPRIDKGPFAEKKHVFKLPFSVHHESRRVSLPVEREAIVSDALPEGLATLGEINSHFLKHGQVEPSLVRGKEIFDQWLSYYVVPEEENV